MSSPGVSSNTSHVGVAGHVGPVLRKDPSAPLVGFALPDDSVAGALEAEVESPDAAEEAADI